MSEELPPLSTLPHTPRVFLRRVTKRGVRVNGRVYECKLVKAGTKVYVFLVSEEAVVAHIFSRSQKAYVGEAIRTDAPAPVHDVKVETRTRYHIEWLAGARPPVHPDPMTGRHCFESFDKAVAHMRAQASDAQFVSLEERTTVTTSIDRSTDVRIAFATTEGSADGN